MDKFQTLATIFGAILGAVTITSIIAGQIGRSHNVDEVKREVRELRDRMSEFGSIKVELVYVKESLKALREEIKEWLKTEGR